MLCSLFPQAPVLALTATASRKDREVIKTTLNMVDVVEVVASPDRKNLFYQKVFRAGPDIEAYENILEPVAQQLLQLKHNYPLTIIYLSLRWCGFAYRLFEKILGMEQYFPPESQPIPENRLFLQFHAPQTSAMKELIIQQLCSTCPTVRVVFATVALGMGVDIPSIQQIIHIGPPRTVREYMQETGRAGRDGSQSTAMLHYNNHDIASNRKDITDEIRDYCRLDDSSCLREYLLECLDAKSTTCKTADRHWCCSNCRSECSCLFCASNQY